MSWAGLRAIVVPAALLALTATQADARIGRIAGTIDRPGYTVIALSAGGEARTAHARRGAFALRPPARTVTLHLRAPGGSYAGPVVVRRAGGRAVLGVRSGARLGRVEVRRGFALPARRLARRRVDARRWSRAKSGVPVGAGRFGRVLSPPRRGVVPADFDLDGIPGVLDVDDDGDRVLDPIDRTRRRYDPRPGRSRAVATAAQTAVPETIGLATDQWVDITDTANANAGTSDEEIEQGLARRETGLTIQIVPGDEAELDCGVPQSRTDPGIGGLVYCTRGGTGMLDAGGPPEVPRPFPACCDADGDGLGTLTPTWPAENGESFMRLYPRATSSQIGTGDVLIQRVTDDGVATQYPLTLPFVFSTNAALVSYRDRAGHSARVVYPVTDGPGSFGNPFPVAAAGGDIVIQLTVWRPQRRPIPGEAGYGTPGSWIDIGGLTYATGGHRPSGRDPFDIASQDFCPQDAYDTDDASLFAPDWHGTTPDGFIDLALDGAADRDKTLTWSVDVTRCLRYQKRDNWDVGESLGLDVQARTGSSGVFGAATQNFWFVRVR